MKTGQRALFCLLTLPLFSTAQVHPQVKAGIGHSMVLQQFHHLNDGLSNPDNELYFKDLGDTRGTHFTVQKLIPLSKNFFLSAGCDVDYVHFSIRTYGVPYRSFANSKLYFDQKQFWADIPVGLGKRVKSSKKTLLLHAGTSIGIIGNSDSKIRYDIFNADDAHNVVYSTHFKNKVTLSTSLWFKIQYQLFKYNCLSHKGMWIEGMVRQNLLYNSVQTFRIDFITPQQTFAYTYAYQNRTFVIGLSCLFDL